MLLNLNKKDVKNEQRITYIMLPTAMSTMSTTKKSLPYDVFGFSLWPLISSRSSEAVFRVCVPYVDGVDEGGVRSGAERGSVAAHVDEDVQGWPLPFYTQKYTLSEALWIVSYDGEVLGKGEGRQKARAHI